MPVERRPASVPALEGTPHRVAFAASTRGQPEPSRHEPALADERAGGERCIVISGDWTMEQGQSVEQAVGALGFAAGETVVLDLSRLGRLDTLGALLVRRLLIDAANAGATARIEKASPSHALLLGEVEPPSLPSARAKTSGGVDVLVDIGKGMHGVGRDIIGGVSFLGAFTAALGRVILKPRSFRWPAFVKQLETIGFRSVPIIALISFLVGGIIAQQSVFQLRSFGTAAFVADLLGILVLRELGVLLTAIMIAGRSGSAITAEIGSMKMREEIDALRTMGLDPMEVLIVPRILALVVAMPLLTFIASMAGLLGGGLVAWIYGDVSPDVFLSRLQNAIKINTFMVGMIKAPVMALVIGLIAAIEGVAVQGSAESLGRQTTASVVKAIFMVILVDGLFAMFFASIRY
jgi:phospholipid/cholesterol/gamma-HCH transport system permease protein